MDGILSWQLKRLQLRGYDRFGGLWVFEDVKPGTYRVRLTYRGLKEVKYYDSEANDFKQLNGFWEGQVVTPFVEMDILEKGGVNKKMQLVTR